MEASLWPAGGGLSHHTILLVPHTFVKLHSLAFPESWRAKPRLLAQPTGELNVWEDGLPSGWRTENLGRGQSRIPWNKAGRCVKENRSLGKGGGEGGLLQPLWDSGPLETSAEVEVQTGFPSFHPCLLRSKSVLLVRESPCLGVGGGRG